VGHGIEKKASQGEYEARVWKEPMAASVYKKNKSAYVVRKKSLQSGKNV